MLIMATSNGIDKDAAGAADPNAAADLSRRQGTRVFKKSTPNGRITAYLGKRDFVDHLTHVDPIDGVVLVDPQYVKERKVFVHVLAAFRYGREDLDVLGLAFRKDLYLQTLQVYPPPAPENRKPLTRLQERLIRKLGDNAYPFLFELPHNTPASVTLQPGPNDGGKPCGVDYELKTYVGDNPDDRPHKRNSVRLAIRKLTYAPDTPGPQPTAEVSKEFLMSAGPLRLEATLDKEKYYHGESIAVNVLVDNNSRKSVKKIKITVFQLADIMLFSRAMYKCVVAELETDESFPIHGNHTGWCKVYTLCPLLANNREKRGLALDGKLKHEDTNLASSTLVPEGCVKDNLGIVVQYKVKVRLYLGFGASDVSVELPFTLTHPKPPDNPILPEADDIHLPTEPVAEEADSRTNTPVPDTDLIHLDTTSHSWTTNDGPAAASSQASQTNPFNGRPSRDSSPEMSEDDVIFESFARLRLQQQPSLPATASSPPASGIPAVENIFNTVSDHPHNHRTT